jgi:hypothetical protein
MDGGSGSLGGSVKNITATTAISIIVTAISGVLESFSRFIKILLPNAGNFVWFQYITVQIVFQ